MPPEYRVNELSIKSNEYMKKGIVYPENTLFCNFPLAIIAYGPYGLLLPVNLAVILKGIQTTVMMVYCLFLVTRSDYPLG